MLKKINMSIVVIACLVTTIFGQIDSARISGTVTDETKAAIMGAVITVKNLKTGEERSVKANEQGTFFVTNLKPAPYKIIITAQGFANAEYKEIELVVGQSFNANVALKPAGTTEAVTIVGGDEASLDTSSARMGANVNENEVKGLPLNGRQLSQLYLQAPGALNSGSGTFGDIRFSGRAVQQNAIRFDGVEGTAIIDASPGNVNGEMASPFRLQSSLENVQEFRVESNSYPAEYGTGSGGQVTVVTKSGGNRYHGSVFEYLRNEKLDARNFFDKGDKSPLKLNQFGGSFGGPIIKDKFFFFGSYEGYRLRNGINIIEAVPSASGCAKATSSIIYSLCTKAFKSDKAVIISGVSKDPNFDIAQLQASNTVNENSGALRLDYTINANNSVYVRYFRDQGYNDQPQNVSGSRAIIKAVPQNGVIAWQSSFGGNKVNEFKVGYNGAYSRVYGVAPTIDGIDLSAITLNITGSVANSGIAGQGTSSGVSIPGGLVRANSATNGRGAPYTPYTISLIDNLSTVRGNHNLKFGGEVRFIRMYTDRLGGTTYTYSSLDNFLKNIAQSVQYNGDVSAPSPFNNGATGQRYAKEEFYIGYAQDEWKIKPNLTFNYGLRYEYYTPLREDQNRQVVFDINTGKILPSDTAIFKANKTNFAPRLSLAWTPNFGGTGFFGGGKTVLRGGFGINYGPGQIEDQIQPIESDRVSTTSNNVLNAFPANIAQINSNFATNVNNRKYQPRAYDLSNYEVPERIYSYTFSLQQELPYKLALTLGYVGSQGRNLFLRSVANNIVSVTTNSDPTQAAIVRREFDIVDSTGKILGSPYAEIDYKRSGGRDSYNALQATLARRFNQGVVLNAQYTYGKSYGNTAGSNEALTAANNARNINDFDYDLGYNNFDVRHSFNISALYSLPFGKNLSGIGKQVISGWDLGGIINMRSGLPVNVSIVRPDVLYVDAAGKYYDKPAVGRTAIINTPRGGASRNVRRPNLVAGVPVWLDDKHTILNPAAFSVPEPGTFGNLMRNSIKGPGFAQFDMTLAKKFSLTESTKLEFRTEVFNLFNHANFANPALQLAYVDGATSGLVYTTANAGSTFGKITRTAERTVGLGTNRQIQFALRLTF